MRSPLVWNSKNEKAVCPLNVFPGGLCSVPDVGLSELTQQSIPFAFLQMPRDAPSTSALACTLEDTHGASCLR